jgi:hypothetical protein
VHTCNKPWCGQDIPKGKPGVSLRPLSLDQAMLMGIIPFGWTFILIFLINLT